MQINQGVSEELFRLFTNLGHAVHHPTAEGEASPLTYTIVRALIQRPRRMTDLLEVTGLDQSSVSRRISALCTAGLIEKIPDEDDRRAHLLRPSRKGVELIDRERARRVRTVTDALDDWSDPDRADLSRLLAHLNSSLESHRGLGHQGA